MTWTPRRSVARTLAASLCAGLGTALLGFVLASLLAAPPPTNVLPLGGATSSPSMPAPAARRLLLDPLLAAMDVEIQRLTEANRTLREELGRTLAERDALRRELEAAAERERTAPQPSVGPPDAAPAAVIAPALPPEPAGAGTPPAETAAPPPAMPDAAPAPPATSELPSSESLKAGVAAYRAGDHERAMALWRPLAERGVAKAQFHLAALYLEGRVGGRALQAAWRWAVRARDAGYAPAERLIEAIEAEAGAQGDLGTRSAPGPAVPAGAATAPCRFAGGCPSHPG